MARGKLIVISAPSGAGKTTIAKKMLERFPSVGFSVSATTRKKRAGELHGRDYFFLTPEEFQKRKTAGDFVEYEELYGDSYGTLRSELERTLSAGRHILFDVDVKGGLSIKRQYPEACLIFISPPDMQKLKERLAGRKTEDDATIARRLERVPMEMKLGGEFDFEVVNNELAQAIAEVESIIKNHLEE